MTLQASGAISLANLQGEYGGANPISMSEYYRGGTYVPTQTTVYGSFSSWYGNSSYQWVVSPTATFFRWGGTATYNFSSMDGVTIGYLSGYQYERGTQYSSTFDKILGYTYYYQIRRRTATLTNINVNVPSSGQISLSNFYGGQAG